MKNWKTTLVGVVGAVITAMVSYIQAGGFEPTVLLQAAVVAALGYLAKDAGVSGTDK